MFDDREFRMAVQWTLGWLLRILWWFFSHGGYLAGFLLGTTTAELRNATDETIAISGLCGLVSAMAIDTFICITPQRRRIAFALLGVAAGIPLHLTVENPDNISMIVTIVITVTLALFHAYQPKEYL